MKALLMAALCLTALLPLARAQQTLDEQYLAIYGVIQQGEQLSDTGDARGACAAFSDALTQLQRFRRDNPDWHPTIVNFRLGDLADKLDQLKGQLPAVAPAATNAAPAAPSTTAALGAAAKLQSIQSKLDDTQSQLQAAQSENAALQARLKEALAVQPATVDTAEFARAQARIRWLMKENDLLKVTRGGAGPAVVAHYVTNVVTVFVTNYPVEVGSLAAAFAKNPTPVVATNYLRVVVAGTNVLELARLDYAAVFGRFDAEHARVEQLAAENAMLRKSLASANSPDAALALQRGENERLKSQLAELRAAQAGSADTAKLTAELDAAHSELAKMKIALEMETNDKLALQARVQRLLAATNAAPSAADYEARLRALTDERNSLLEKLAAAQKNSVARGADTVAQMDALNDELKVLRARLAIDEAQAVPFSAEELALFRASPPAVPPAPVKKSIKELPAGTAELVASAQRHFSDHDFPAAEADYQKILDRDQNNGLVQANLATIELQEGKLAAAEKHILAALAQSPDDAYNLTTLGELRFRQGKYDDALNALSRAAQMDPQNPEIQNYLGLTLSHKGLRNQAETALRKAIEINPDYAPAHNNLAVIYLTEKPPMPALARWHYQKALAAGEPRNPELEKMLAEKGAPVSH